MKRESSYAAIFAALTDLAAADPARIAVDDFPGEADVDPDDLAALDAAWEDAPVTFGPEAASACKDDLVARIRAAKRPAARPA